MPKPTLTELKIHADPDAWRALGLEVDEHGLSRIGSVPLRFDPGDGPGPFTWAPSDLDPAALDGLPFHDASAPRVDTPQHPLAIPMIDHLVAFTPSLERTIEAFEAAGVRCRRVREVGPPDQQLRQAFFRFGEVICEVVQVPEDKAGPNGEARFWGVTLVCDDLDAAAERLGERLGTIRDAIQPGRRIGTVRKEAGLGLPVALISPQPPKD